jgi:hypothetical protein
MGVGGEGQGEITGESALPQPPTPPPQRYRITTPREQSCKLTEQLLEIYGKPRDNLLTFFFWERGHAMYG